MNAEPSYFLEQQAAFMRALEADIDRCEPWISAALDNSARSHRFNDVKAMILAGNAHLWSVDTGCAVTCFSTFPESKMLQVWLLGGEFEKVHSECSDKIEAFARQNGCDQMFVNGRKGWERRLKDRGYKFAAVILTKEL